MKSTVLRHIIHIIDRVIIYKDKNEYKDIKHLSSSGSSEGTSISHKRTKKDITLLDIKSPLLEELKDYWIFSVFQLSLCALWSLDNRKNNGYTSTYVYSTQYFEMGSMTFNYPFSN